MMDEIRGAVLSASRVGYEVGRQMQVDRVINEWVQHANSYKAQRDEAWDEIRSLKAKLSETQEERRVLQAKLKDSETQCKTFRASANTLERKNASLSDEVARLTKWKRDALASVQKHLSEVETSKKTEEGERKKLVEKLNLQTARLTATWARLTGAERVLGRLVSELLDRAPTVKLEMLDDGQRRSVLERAWTDVVKSKAKYEPALSFTFEPLPI
ncbi:hypothetical protein [Duganella vulcania]|uniref:Uncharacterized protein n=1 Tax=Duganella vulcania TaxID=2692166 RepID=A0A845GNG6_9BURK|nr:hypothetical protein [Duganella vulcania]MYM96093.1 hypothetical protein [Duganella vulcania]